MAEVLKENYNSLIKVFTNDTLISKNVQLEILKKEIKELEQ